MTCGLGSPKPSFFLNLIYLDTYCLSHDRSCLADQNLTYITFYNTIQLYLKGGYNMFITGLGNVVGIGPMTKLCVSGSVVRVKELDDQHLSLLIPAVLRGDPITHAVPGSDNRPLRNRLLRLNPCIRPNRDG